uniref:Ovule protein n=1 Tax=Heterorhabditis bacteriophora TaxID=37862 RepID=A0A1I7W6K5_HETBA
MSMLTQHNFLWKIITGHEKWIMYDNPKHSHSWSTTSTCMLSRAVIEKKTYERKNVLKLYY